MVKGYSIIRMVALWKVIGIKGRPKARGSMSVKIIMNSKANLGTHRRMV